MIKKNFSIFSLGIMVKLMISPQNFLLIMNENQLDVGFL